MDFIQLETHLQEGIRARITPGVCASIGIGDSPAWHGYYGNLGTPKPAPVDVNTIYDLASLTKVLCTTLLTAYALWNRKLDLDETPFPNWPGVTIQHLLEHTAGLPAHLEFYRLTHSKRPFAENKEIILKQVYVTKPIVSPGKRTLYSDLGFIALGDLLEERLGEKLDVAFHDISNQHFGLHGLEFVDLNQAKIHSNQHQVAPTGYCEFRNRWLWGEVHDNNCYAMGGIAGHAGLFGRLNDVQQAVIWFTKAIQGKEGGLPSVIRSFANHRTQANRALGFDRPHKGGSTGRFLSPHGIGHLGFTGVSFWIDPDTFHKNTFYILLTNRVLNNTKSAEIQAFRTGFHEQAYRAIQVNTNR